MLELVTLFFTQLPSAAWSAAGALGVLGLQKLLPSRQETKDSKREDFKAITDSLFKDIEALRSDVETYKQEANQCEERYQDLQARFLDFRAKHNELELRYKVQVQINQKISEEVKFLEEQVMLHIEQAKLQSKNDDKEPTVTTLRVSNTK
jgi:predicted nuclease with TOPRIM domain